MRLRKYSAHIPPTVVLALQEGVSQRIEGKVESINRDLDILEEMCRIGEEVTAEMVLPSEYALDLLRQMKENTMVRQIYNSIEKYRL